MKIPNGILEGGSGRVGSVVGADWKGIKYIRKYVIPANPNTTAQQNIRNLFGKLVGLGRKLLGQVIQPYWDPFYTKMSGFNAFLRENMNAMGTSLDLTKLIVSKGSLEGDTGWDGTYNSTNDSVLIQWNGTTTGNGQGTDNALAVLYDATNDVFYFGTAQRQDGSVTLNVNSNFDDANAFLYGFFHRGSGASLEVSDSGYGPVHP